ncbi:MAG: gas vesicle protein GvpH [Candidatus Nanopelagicales bacterium]|nr:gas vesicle protein GvpH [Candidatus Nanopelagicales bacterium]MDZ4249149.1 gas vesicle protein GvpH [Candidatus Nanopelagicales bacterium]MDZ7577489.1 gas vesicle protein GvpH [Candidatus Nanopelagicales bacterium]
MASERDRRPGGGSGIFGDLSEFIRKLGDLAQGESTSGQKEFTLPGGAQGVYGFSVRMGLGRETPVVSEFGNVKVTNEGAVVSETREPLIDIFDEGDEILLVAELPGVKDADVELDVRGDVVALTAKGTKQKYACEALLSAEVDPEPVARDCENGYLQLRFTKKSGSSASGGSGSE